MCEELAKDEVNEAASSVNDKGIMETEITANLPLELASLYIGDSKQISDVVKDLRYFMGKAQARPVFILTGVMSGKVFDQVCWKDLWSTLNKKPQMYQLWFIKQGSGYCGTGKF